MRDVRRLLSCDVDEDPAGRPRQWLQPSQCLARAERSSTRLRAARTTQIRLADRESHRDSEAARSETGDLSDATHRASSGSSREEASDTDEPSRYYSRPDTKGRRETDTAARE